MWVIDSSRSIIYVLFTIFTSSSNRRWVKWNGNCSFVRCWCKKIGIRKQSKILGVTGWGQLTNVSLIRKISCYQHLFRNIITTIELNFPHLKNPLNVHRKMESEMCRKQLHKLNCKFIGKKTSASFFSCMSFYELYAFGINWNINVSFKLLEMHFVRKNFQLICINYYWFIRVNSRYYACIIKTVLFILSSAYFIRYAFIIHLGCKYKTYGCIAVVGIVWYKHPTILLLQCCIAINCLASANQLWHYSFSKITNFETKHRSKWSKRWFDSDCDQGNSES